MLSDRYRLVFYLLQKCPQICSPKTEIVYLVMVKTIDTINKKHEGAIVKRAISQVGLSCAMIANRMRISTSTLYRKLKSEKLNDFFILRIEYALGNYDLSADFPRLRPTREAINQVQEIELAHYKSKYLGTLRKIEKRYIDLLQAHKKVLIALLGLKEYLISNSPLCGDVAGLIKEISAEL